MKINSNNNNDGEEDNNINDDRDFREKELESVKFVRSSKFSKHGHKGLMCLGLLALDCEQAQTRLGDRDAFDCVMSYLRIFGCQEASFAKWSFWTTSNLTYQHPPNKKIFVESNGLDIAMDAMKSHMKDADVIHQGIIMLTNILSRDSKAKMNLANARQQALACGVVDVVQAA